MTAPLLRTPHRPLRRPDWARPTSLRSAVAHARRAAAARRWDDRPGIERHASLGEITLRSLPSIDRGRS